MLKMPKVSKLPKMPNPAYSGTIDFNFYFKIFKFNHILSIIDRAKRFLNFRHFRQFSAL